MAMTMEKARLLKRMDALSDKVAEHLSKCAMYGDTLESGKYNHWIEDELATYLSFVNEVLSKHNNGKLKPEQYESSLFGWLGDDKADALGNLIDLQLHNKKSSEPYPYVKIDNDMTERMYKISKGVVETFVPIISTINDLTKENIELKLHQIIDPVCKNIGENK